MTNWSVDDSKATYCLSRWSEGYVDVGQHGHLVMRPYRDAAAGEIDMKALLDEIQNQDISLPVLIRFQDILKDRINCLCQVFKNAFDKHDYSSRYTAVYPIKVNQQFSVVSEIIHHGDENIGLEAGSKPELMAVLSLAETGKHTIICNGYKDREYIRLALIAKKLGHKIFIVLEKTSELDLVLQEAAELKVEPSLGLRLRLASMGKGKWQNTGGEKAKFGLSAEQILDIIKQLQQKDCGSWIQLLHFHMGSQIANLADIKTGLAEAAQYFIELNKLGVKIQTLDIGGGIGVDYEGRAAKSEFSVNYTLQEYADAVIGCFSRACIEYEIEKPSVITECGRAMTAHHAVLVTEVINAEQTEEIVFKEIPQSTSTLLQRAYSIYEESFEADPVLIYQQINALYHQAQSAFVKNNLSITERADLEKIYLACCQQLKKNLSHEDAEQQDLLNDINQRLADKIVCNLSIFQSIPDVWGISQIFPIVPLQSLDKRPDRRAIIQDLTCDSDGQIEKYVDRYGIESSLPIHQIQENEKYLLGIFMVGAYQEILGDMHNLFGDTNTINVYLEPGNKFRLADPEAGDTVTELLSYVHFDTDKMMEIYQRNIEKADLTEQEAKMYLDELLNGLDGYTYLE